MIKETIKSTIENYFNTVTKEQFVHDLRVAGFTIYETEENVKSNFKSIYYCDISLFSRDDYYEYPIVTKKIKEKLALPKSMYQITIGSGEFEFTDVA